MRAWSRSMTQTLRLPVRAAEEERDAMVEVALAAAEEPAEEAGVREEMNVSKSFVRARGFSG